MGEYPITKFICIYYEHMEVSTVKCLTCNLKFNKIFTDNDTFRFSKVFFF